MKIIGLCGGSGSGKTTAASVMETLGAAVIDTDRVYREICTPGSPCLKELTAAFGCGILSSDGSLDRKSLGRCVFSDQDARHLLNSISHAYILDETKRLIAVYERGGFSVVVVDAPLLFEAGFDLFCDITVGVTAPTTERILRIVARDGTTREAAESRIRSQLSDEELRRKCDFIIENHGDLGEFISRVRSFYMSAVSGGVRS